MKKLFFILVTMLLALQGYSQSHYRIGTEAKYDSIYALDDQYFAAKFNGKWGVVKDNTTIVSYQYEAIESLGDNMLTFIQDGKVGFVNIETQEVIPAKYMRELDYSRVEKSSLNIFTNGSALVYDGQKLRVIDTKGKDVVGDTVEIITKSNNTIIYRKDAAYGMMDAMGRVTAPAKYMQIETVIPGQLYAYIGVREGMKLYGLIDAKGEQKSLAYYDDVQLINKNDKFYVKAFLPTGKQSLYDANGDIIFQPLYSLIEPTTMPFYYNITEDTKRGIIGRDMVIYIPPVYEDVQVMALNNDTFFVARNEGVSFILNKQNQLLTHYEGGISGFISYSKDNIIFVADSFLNYGVMSSKDGWLIRPEYDEALGFVKDNVILMKNKKWGAVSLTGKTVIPFEYSKVKLANNRSYVVFYDGKKTSVVLDENARQITFDKVKKIKSYDKYIAYDVKDKEQRIYLSGEQMNSSFKSVGTESEGLYPVQDEKGWTYADSETMKVVSDKRFNFCTYFRNSQALAVQGNNLIVIDKNFNTIDTLITGDPKSLRTTAAALIFAPQLKKSNVIVKVNGKYGVLKVLK